MPRPIRLGMVGGGEGSFIGGVHRIASRIDGQFHLVAGALSSDAGRNRSSGMALGIEADRCYSSFQDMARVETGRDDGIEAVAIVTPNHMHAEPVRVFLAAGIHVICDKPLTATLDQALALAADIERSEPLFVLTHNYTGYPMIRQARQMIADGAIGGIRMVAAEYVQGWLATRIEDTGNKQAVWRTDPAKSGPAGALGDIGTHAFNLAEFVTGLRVEAVCADAAALVSGRRVDDNTTMLLRFANGARGTLWCSQIAIGCQNRLTLRVYGERGSLEWEQESPELLKFASLGEPVRTIVRGGDGMVAAAAHASRIPGGHPEGYLEGFAQIYRDTADLIRAKQQHTEPSADARLVPGLEAGVRGMRFIAASLESSASNGRWTALLP
ncbi:MAG: Gfo/Idh/MocA family oxidoreductase [Pseudomonadota bacterium]